MTFLFFQVFCGNLTHTVLYCLRTTIINENRGRKPTCDVVRDGRFNHRVTYHRSGVRHRLLLRHMVVAAGDTEGCCYCWGYCNGAEEAGRPVHPWDHPYPGRKEDLDISSQHHQHHQHHRHWYCCMAVGSSSCHQEHLADLGSAAAAAVAVVGVVVACRQLQQQ